MIVGAGIHGLSTAYHLAKELRARGAGSGADVVVLEKSEPGAGASGIACGVVRNNYFQPAMSELMQACVEVWESDPAAYAYNPVGYMALGPAVQESDLAATFERQERIGYRSTFVTGEAEVDAYMKRSSRTGVRRASPRSCTSTRAASPSTASRCSASRASARRRASRSSPASRCGRSSSGRRHRERARDEPRPDRGRRAARDRARPVGEALLVDAGAALDDRRAHAVGRGVRPADVDVLEPPGGRDQRRPADVRDGRRRRPSSTSTPTPPLHRRRRAGHRRALGHLLQARPARRPGRRLAARRRRRRRARPLSTDVDPASRTCGAPRSRTR